MKKVCCMAAMVFAALFLNTFSAKSQTDTSTVQKLLQYIMHYTRFSKKENSFT